MSDRSRPAITLPERRPSAAPPFRPSPPAAGLARLGAAPSPVPVALGAHPALTLAADRASSAATRRTTARSSASTSRAAATASACWLPTDAAEHAAYARSRGALALAREPLLELLAGTDETGARKRAAPGRRRAASAVRRGAPRDDRERRQPGRADHARAVREPQRRALPAQLFSHSDQAIQWQQLQGRGRGHRGLGRAERRRAARCASTPSAST